MHLLASRGVKNSECLGVASSDDKRAVLTSLDWTTRPHAQCHCLHGDQRKHQQFGDSRGAPTRVVGALGHQIVIPNYRIVWASRCTCWQIDVVGKAISTRAVPFDCWSPWITTATMTTTTSTLLERLFPWDPKIYAFLSDNNGLGGPASGPFPIGLAPKSSLRAARATKAARCD